MQLASKTSNFSSGIYHIIISIKFSPVGEGALGVRSMNLRGSDDVVPCRCTFCQIISRRFGESKHVHIWMFELWITFYSRLLLLLRRKWNGVYIKMASAHSIESKRRHAVAITFEVTRKINITGRVNLYAFWSSRKNQSVRRLWCCERR